MTSLELVLAVAIPTVVLASLFLASMCVYRRRNGKNKSDRANQDPESRNSDNRCEKAGVTNAACVDTVDVSATYETCGDVYEDQNVTEVVYDYATIRRGYEPKASQKKQSNSENTSDDYAGGSVYAVLEGPSSEEVVTSDPVYFTLEDDSTEAANDVGGIKDNMGYTGDDEVTREQSITSDPVYFTLEKDSRPSTNVDSIKGHDDDSGFSEMVGTDEDAYVINIADELYKDVSDDLPKEDSTDMRGCEEVAGIHPDTHLVDVADELYENVSEHDLSRKRNNKGSDGNGTSGTRTANLNRVISGGNEDNEGYTKSDVTNSQPRQDHENESFNDEGVYVIVVDEDFDQERNPDDGIYENWEDETICGKVFPASHNVIQKKEDEGITSESHEAFRETDNVEDSSYSTTDNIYQNLADVRNSLVR